MPVEFFSIFKQRFRKEINPGLSDYVFVFISVTYCPSFTTLDRWIPSNYPITENIRAIYLTLEKLIQSEETQVNGIVILADYKGVSLSKASHFGPFIAKKVIGILQVWLLSVMYLSCGCLSFPGPCLPPVPPNTQTPPPTPPHSQDNTKAWEEIYKSSSPLILIKVSSSYWAKSTLGQEPKNQRNAFCFVCLFVWGFFFLAQKTEKFLTNGTEMFLLR